MQRDASHWPTRQQVVRWVRCSRTWPPSASSALFLPLPQVSQVSSFNGKESRLFLPTVAGAPRVSCIDGRRVAWPAAFGTKDSKSSTLTILCLSPLHGAIQREKDVKAQCLTSGPSCTPSSSAEQAPPQKLPLLYPRTSKTKK